MMAISFQPKDGASEEWATQTGREINLFEALTIARRSVEKLSAQPFDSIAVSKKLADGRWLVVVDTIETRARLGNNDLLSAYQVVLGQDGELVSYSRLHRYHREDVHRS